MHLYLSHRLYHVLRWDQSIHTLYSILTFCSILLQVCNILVTDSIVYWVYFYIKPPGNLSVLMAPLFPLANIFSVPPLMSFQMSFYVNQLTLSLSVFIATIWITTKRTVPSTTAHTVISLHQGTLNVYVYPPSVIFARTGDTPTNSALVDIVTVTIPSDTCLMIVGLKTLPQNRQWPSL